MVRMKKVTLTPESTVEELVGTLHEELARGWRLIEANRTGLLFQGSECDPDVRDYGLRGGLQAMRQD